MEPTNFQLAMGFVVAVPVAALCILCTAVYLLDRAKESRRSWYNSQYSVFDRKRKYY